MFVGGFLDSPPRRVAFVIADPFNLVEPGNSIAYVTGVVDRFLALLGERELVAVDMVALGSVSSVIADSFRLATTRREPKRGMK